jgi:hypothetical protein
LFSEQELQDLFETYFEHLHKIWNPRKVFVGATEWDANIVKTIARNRAEDGVIMEAGTKVKWPGLQSGSYFTDGADPNVTPTVRGVVVPNHMLISEVEDFAGLEPHNTELMQNLARMVKVDWLAPNGEVICTAWHSPDQLDAL